jgi:polyhydroxybutyrate depolymerase
VSRLWLISPWLVVVFACSSGTAAHTAPVTPTAVTAGAVLLPDASPEPAATPAPLDGPVCGQPAEPGDSIGSVERPEGTRSFRIHVPPGYDGAKPVPLILNFHGQAKTALDQETYSGLTPVSDAEGFMLVSPEGSSYPQEWSIIGDYENGWDDVGFVSDILANLEAAYCIDPDRVFATGMSNGAEMASQVACYLPGVFAGIAPVAGILFQGCEGPPVAVITFHGTDDFNVPYFDTPDAVASWAIYNGCPEEPEHERIGEHVDVESYFGCSGQPVVFYTLEEGGHTWPGAPDDSGGAGPTNHEINASELIWDFFERVRRQS